MTISIARWIAVAIAVLAVVDPPIPWTRQSRPGIEIVAAAGENATEFADALRAQGFAVNAQVSPAARVVIGPALTAVPLDRPLWALDTSPAAPNVRIVRATVRPMRVPNQVAQVEVELAADGVAGAKTELRVADAGIVLASATHTWTQPNERWGTVLRFAPATAAASLVTVSAVALPSETSTADNLARLRLPAARGPLRTLVYEPSVTWPSVFLRRSLEAYPEFDLSASSRASRGAVTRAGSPPPALTRAALEPYEVVVVGAPDALTASEADILAWFARVRGGTVALVPDRAPTARVAGLLPGITFSPRQVTKPVQLNASGRPALRAAELLAARGIPATAEVLAEAEGDPVVFRLPFGEGSILFSGAVDAWRYRADDDDGFGRFWRGAIVEAAADAAPPVDLAVEPTLVRPGDRVTVTVRLRAARTTEGEVIAPGAVAARVVAATGASEFVRLWPAAEPGAYAGEWRATGAGDAQVEVRAGDVLTQADVSVSDDAPIVPAADPDSLAAAARTTGGAVFRDPGTLAETLGRRFPAAAAAGRAHPMRSPWWGLPFAAGLCAEWAVRRRRGRH